ncbi:MAG: radical SAM protein [Armatimonadota bacterium]
MQEGCNSRCSYCIVPEARGPSRSVPFAEVYEQALTLARSGHPELVLIGTHLGQYGRDLQPSSVGRGLVPRREAYDTAQTARYEPAPYRRGAPPDPSQPLDVTELLLRLAAIPEVQRLRLGSMEPREVSPALIEMVREGGQALERPPADGTGKLCRHLHIPLQSGSDSVLQRMNRPYTGAFYADVIQRLHEAQPLTGLGADVIVGFPGETDEEFEQTRALVERLPLTYLHVFAYSPRQGTPAADMPDQVPPPVKAQRSQILRELSTCKHQAFAEKMMGLTLETVLQTVTEEGWQQGVTDTYLTLRVQADEGLLGRLLACEVAGVEDGVLVGRVVG